MATYTISAANIKAKISEEVSLAADEAYAEDATSLYDSIVTTSKDDGLIGSLINDAIRKLVKAVSDIAVYTSGTVVTFTVPDFDSTNMSSALSDEIDRYAALSACTDLFKMRKPDRAPQYEIKAQEAMENVIRYLRTRKAPTR